MEHPARRQRLLIATVQILGLSVWFSATAVVPSLTTEWDLSPTTAVWLTASVQIGFVCGAVASAALNLADRVPATRLMAVSAAGAAIATMVLALTANSVAQAVPLRFLTGVFLAGIYPVGMKLTASWSQTTDRARAFGLLIGALTLGSALPHLISGLGQLPWRAVMGSASILAFLAAIVTVIGIDVGPNMPTGTATPNPRYALTMFRDRGPRLANIGYFGHMWELYALWTWMALYLTHSVTRRPDDAGTPIELLTFAAIGIAGFAGCVLGGAAADRYGRSRAAATAMVVSGTCCLASPLAFGAPLWVTIPFLAVWGISVIADSGVFSTALSETADPRYVGTALTAQTAVGFLLTVVTIQAVPVIAELVGWQYAFLILAPGPLVGAMAMSRYRSIERIDITKEEHHDPIHPHHTDSGTDRGADAHRWR